MTADRLKPGIEISPWVEMKWARALHHVHDLQSRLALWDLSGHTFADLTLSEDRRVVTSVLRVYALPPLTEYSLLLGDAVHNLRGALDALAWELAHLNGAQPAAPREIYFPAATRPEAWDDANGRRGWSSKLATIPEPFLGRIRELQPFHAEDPARDLLALLAAMSNRDKHQGMITAHANVQGIQIGFSIEQDDLGSTTPDGVKDGFTLSPIGDPTVLVDGNPLMRWEMSLRVTLARDRTPVGLSYLVEVGGERYDLQSLLEGMLQVRAAIHQVCGDV